MLCSGNVTLASVVLTAGYFSLVHSRRHGGGLPRLAAYSRSHREQWHIRITALVFGLLDQTSKLKRKKKAVFRTTVPSIAQDEILL